MTSALLLPPELIELAERPSVGRLVLLALNLAVVVVLIRRALHEHRAHSVQPK